jgi:predicted DNA-binding transcriptional regulator AlpA
MHPDKAENDRDPITVTVPRACELSGFGLTTIWKFIKDGRLKVSLSTGRAPSRWINVSTIIDCWVYLLIYNWKCVAWAPSKASVSGRP